jgi:guanylate kinase
MSDGAPLPFYVPRAAHRGRLFVVSGPSGVGKDTVIHHFLPTLPNVVLNVSATTRAPRPGESEGNPYFFVSVADFREMVERDEFLEYARVNGNLYGTPHRWVEEQRTKGIDVLLKIDVQGGLTVRTKMRDAVLIFLMPPSVDELERRLRDRMTETEEQITTRLLDARSELQQIPNYDYAVMNDDVGRASDLLRAIFLAERCRVHATQSGGPSVPWSPHE